MAYGSFAGSGFCRAMVQLLYGGNITGRQRRAMCSALGVLVVLLWLYFFLLLFRMQFFLACLATCFRVRSVRHLFHYWLLL